VRGRSAEELRTLIISALDLARSSGDFRAFRTAYHKRFRRDVICDSRETIPATLAIVLLAQGDPTQATILSANFGRDSDTIGCMAGGICGALQGLRPVDMSTIARMSPGVRQSQLRLGVELARLAASKAAREMAALANRL
jgi:ADP-ribosylglycohydrolase